MSDQQAASLPAAGEELPENQEEQEQELADSEGAAEDYWGDYGDDELCDAEYEDEQTGEEEAAGDEEEDGGEEAEEGAGGEQAYRKTRRGKRGGKSKKRKFGGATEGQRKRQNRGQGRARGGGGAAWRHSGATRRGGDGKAQAGPYRGKRATSFNAGRRGEGAE